MDAGTSDEHDTDDGIMHDQAVIDQGRGMEWEEDMEWEADMEAEAAIEREVEHAAAAAAAGPAVPVLCCASHRQLLCAIER